LATSGAGKPTRSSASEIGSSIGILLLDGRENEIPFRFKQMNAYDKKSDERGDV
jgi:hypothetical protein